MNPIYLCMVIYCWFFWKLLNVDRLLASIDFKLLLAKLPNGWNLLGHADIISVQIIIINNNNKLNLYST